VVEGIGITGAVEKGNAYIDENYQLSVFFSATRLELTYCSRSNKTFKIS
jgi:hypothetical protein